LRFPFSGPRWEATSDQQRADPWLIITWLTERRVRCLIVENVPEFQSWGLVDVRTGRPLKSRRGEYFRQWAQTITGLGYDVDWRVLSVADYGAATTRQRFFLIARSDGKPLRWPEPTHARVPQAAPLFGTMRARWRAAREIIDWSLRGTSILTREAYGKRPLAAQTLLRIYAGIVRFGWPQPFVALMEQYMASRGSAFEPRLRRQSSVPEPTPAPFIFANRTHTAPKSLDEPTPAILTARHLGVVEPFVFRMNQGHDRFGEQRPVSTPRGTVTATGTDLGLVEPVLLSQGDDSRDADGAGAHNVDVPALMTPCDGVDQPIEPLIAPYYSQGSGQTCRSVNDPLPSCTTKARFGIVMPLTHAGTGARVRDAACEPLPTVTCAHRGELAFITAAFGEREGQAPRVHSVDDPTPTICAQGRVNLVQPGAEVDILFRILDPRRELAATMGFNSEETRYEFCGTKTDVHRQIGNAVSVEQAAALVGALMAD